MRLLRREFYSGDIGEDLAKGLGACAGLIIEGMRSPRIFAWARRAMWEAALPVTAQPPQIAAAIYTKQREDMVFAQDPYCTELMISAEKLLGLDPDDEQVRGGDCDDNIIVFGAALMSVGIPVRLLVRNYPKVDQLHLMLEYDRDLGKRGKWTCFDATSPDGACFSGYSDELVAPLEVGPMIRDEPVQLLTFGQPPTFGDSGQNGSSSSALPSGQGDAWIEMLTQAKAHLDFKLTVLAEATATLERVRSDLGFPAADPSSSSSDTPTSGTSPLQAYAQTGKWTESAQNAQAKLVQTGQFVSGVLGDALSGARQLYWQSGDLFVGALDGDAYGVLMKPVSSEPGAALVPQYVDLSTGKPTGQVGFGIAPIVIGIAIVAVSLAAVWAVTKIVDYMASAHRDDAMTKVAAGQQALVDSGKETPEQAQAFVRAAQDLVSAPPPGAASSGLGIGALLAAAFGGALVGIVGVEVLPKLVPRVSFGGSPA
jgi:hypothetical protein